MLPADPARARPSDSDRRLADRLRAVDPWGPALALAAAAVFTLHGFEDTLSRDLGVYAYGGQQAADGVPPYVSILNRAGPLSHLIPGVGVVAARLAGIDDVLGMRLLVLVLSAVTVWLAYLLARDTLGSRLEGAVAATALLTFQGFVVLAAGGPRDKPIMVMLLTWSLLAVVRRQWASAGVLVALTTLTWQPAFPVGALVAAVGMASLGRRALVAPLVRFTVGGLVPTVLCVLGFWLAGALPTFIDAFLVIPLRYTVQTGLVEFLGTNGDALVEGYGPAVWAMLAGLVALAVAASRQLVRNLRGGRAGHEMVMMGAGLLAGLLVSMRGFNGWPDAFVLLPFASLGLAVIVHALRSALPRTGRVVGVGVVGISLAAGGMVSVTSSSEGLPLQRASVRAVLTTLGPDASVLSVEAPQVLVLSGRTSSTRYQMFAGGMSNYIDHHYPGGTEGYARWVEAEEPTVIAVHSNGDFEWLADILERDYVAVGTAPGWTWFVDRTVGNATLDQVRRAQERAQERARRNRR